MMSRVLLSILCISSLGLPAGADAAEREQRGADFWTPHYLLDYGLATGGLLLELFYRGEPRERALIGPSFDPADPAAILTPEHSELLGSSFMPEDQWTVPNSWLEIAAYGQLIVVPAHELLAHWGRGQEVSAHRMHHALLSVYQATALNAGLSRVIKAHTGRLRPDFQDRVRHVYCSLPDQHGVDCSDVDPSMLFDDPDEALYELREGRYSFISGHATNAMLVATNLALQTGGLWVWGDGATPTSRGVGISAMVVLYGFGAFSGISRTSLMDEVHHTTDVIAGSMVGVAMGNAFYWLHFDRRGNPRPQHWLSRRAPGARESEGLSNARLIFGGTSLALTAAW